MNPFITILLGLLLLVSCQHVPANKEETKKNQATNKPIAVPTSLSSLFTPDAGVLRGIDFSSTKTSIQSKETVSAVNDTRNRNNLKYSVDLNETDFADITYYFGGETLQKIQVDVFTEETSAADQLFNEITNFFNKKYKVRKSIWEGSENGKSYTIYAKQLKSGLYIVYEPI